MSHPRRVFCNLSDQKNALPIGACFDLSDQDSHHFRNVMRVSLGDQLTVVSKESGREYLTEIVCISDQVQVSVLEENEKIAYFAPVKSIIFASSKGKKNDFVCEKATELGVENIIFCDTERSVARISSGSDPENKLTRWKRIAEAAAKQSERSSLPEIRCFEDLTTMFEYLTGKTEPQDGLLCCSLSDTSIDLYSALKNSSAAHILVGPEGGLTSEEELRTMEHGFKLVSLGPCKLRAETAAIAAIASVQTILGKV